MKFCSKCGNQLFDEAVICPKCGCNANTSFKEKNEMTPKNQAMGTIMIIAGIAIILITIFLVMQQL